MQLDDFTTPWGSVIHAHSRKGTVDWNTLTSCITQDEYQVGRLPEGGIAIDVGGYIGACSLALASRGYKVFMVEPLPENVAVAKMNVILSAFDISIYEKALTSDGEPITIYYSDTSSLLGKQHEFIGMPIKNDKVGRSIKVPSITLEQILNNNGIERCNFLKVDIEGGEWDIFKNLSEDILDRIDRIAIEIDGTKEKPATTTDFLKLLKGKFYDASPEYFPDWHQPAQWIHGYFIHK